MLSLKMFLLFIIHPYICKGNIHLYNIDIHQKLIIADNILTFITKPLLVIQLLKNIDFSILISCCFFYGLMPEIFTIWSSDL